MRRLIVLRAAALAMMLAAGAAVAQTKPVAAPANMVPQQAVAYGAEGTPATASVVDANTITYIAATAPGAVMAIGCYDRSVRPGEARAYRVSAAAQGTFSRE
jgi:hypothetical protein